MREFLNNTSVGRIFIAAVFYYAKQKWFLSWFCSTSLCVCAFRFMFVLVLREWKRGMKRSRAKKVTCKKKVSVIKRLNIISRITNILIIFALLIFYFFSLPSLSAAAGAAFPISYAWCVFYGRIIECAHSGCNAPASKKVNRDTWRAAPSLPSTLHPEY